MSEASAYRRGDYRVVADRLQPAAEHLVAACSPLTGALVVDVGAGSGNVAAAALARSARVLAVDLSEDQLRLGAPVYGSGVLPVVGDGLRLPVRSNSADAALSAFCVMYAASTREPVLEMARVVRQGGVVGVTTWAENGFQVAAHHAVAEFGIEGSAGLAAWADEEFVRTAIATVCAEVVIEYGELRSAFESVEACWSIASTTAPPIVTARERLDDAAFAALGAAFRHAAQTTGQATANGFTLVDRYLVAVGRGCRGD
ncbi:MAG TPA: class I SAM-dependent methyltransferase [Mycobacteriales bacterium]|nr:class I SAM-dependent methyltransferase [Mycobacteriales bacterium]